MFNSCDFVERSVCPEKEARSTKSHEPTRTAPIVLMGVAAAKEILTRVNEEVALGNVAPTKVGIGLTQEKL